MAFFDDEDDLGAANSDKGNGTADAKGASLGDTAASRMTTTKAEDTNAHRVGDDGIAPKKEGGNNQTSSAETASSTGSISNSIPPGASPSPIVDVLPTSVTTTAQQLLPTSVLRNLYDKLYEKRKAAALEVEQIVKSLAGAGDMHRVHALLSMLVRDYALSPLSNHRKGGLIGLAAATVGLVGNFSTFLPLIVPPVLRSFNDADSRVRYYACEALYNIAKVARDDFVTFFNDCFDALCKLSADVDPNVQNAAHLLDKLVKDIVTESPHFDIEEFIELLRTRLQVSNPYVRQFLVSWISVLDSVPDIDMLEYLSEFLEGLFNMLSDPNRDIRQQADAVLVEFLSEIKVQCNQSASVASGSRRRVSSSSPSSSPRALGSSGQAPGDGAVAAHVPFNFGALAKIVVSKARMVSDEFTQLIALSWLHDFVELDGGLQLTPLFDEVLDAVLPCLSHINPKMCQVAESTNRSLMDLDTTRFGATFDPMATIKVIKKHLDNRITINDASTSTGAHAASSSTSSMDNNGVSVGEGNGDMAGADNGDGGNAALGASGGNGDGDYVTLSAKNYERTWLEALRWLSVLLERHHDAVLSQLQELLPLLLNATADGCETVVMQALEVQASLAKSDKEFQRLIAALLDRFRGKRGRRLLQERGSVVIRRLCALLGAEQVYLTVSALLKYEMDLPFASMMVQALNLILLTAPELASPRKLLKQMMYRDPNDEAVAGDGTSGIFLFRHLYHSWCHSSGAVVSLCLLSGAHHHACNLLSSLADLIPEGLNGDALLEMDRLVTLIESPIFSQLRFNLLEPQRFPALCKAMYAILALLPQSKAFDTLFRRMQSMPSNELIQLNSAIVMGQSQSSKIPNLLGINKMNTSASASTASAKSANKGILDKSSSSRAMEGAIQSLDWQELTNAFRECQTKHMQRIQ